MSYTRIVMLAVIVSGVVLGAFTALERITGHTKGRRNWFRIARGLIISTLLAQMAVIGTGLHRTHPSLLFLFFTLLFLSGPLEYIRYYTFLHPGTKVPLPVILPLAPAVPLFLLELYIHLRPQGEKLALFGKFFSDPLHHGMMYVFAACLLMTVTYTGMLLYKEIALLKVRQLRRPLRFSIVLSVMVLLSTAVSCLFFFTGDEGWVLLGVTGISLVFILYFLFKNRFPDFFQLVVKEMKMNRYRRTLLGGLDYRAIQERLAELMNEEKLYRDMDLRMKDVAERLLITPHQFSQLLNEDIKTDFRNYVNRFRVEEAKRLLVEDPSRSIISICFEVGFNSKASFNITFKKMTGMSPKEYREKYWARN